MALKSKVDPTSSASKEVSKVPSVLPEALQDFPEVSTFKELQNDIKRVHLEGVSLDESERLAAKFLDALIQLGGIEGLIKSADLDSRMKKNGYKTMRAQVYLEIVRSAEKKPTEAQIEAELLTNVSVSKAQDQFEKAETHAESLHRLYDIFRDAHIFFRGIAKGSFNGS